MKNLKTYFTLFMVLVLSLSGCSTSSSFIDTGCTFENPYTDYSYWEQDNQLKLITNYSISSLGDTAPEITEIGTETLSNKDSRTIKKLQEGIISYFSENYDIDLTEKISKQEVKIFSSNLDSGITMGYVDPEHQNILNLNEILFTKEYYHLFENTYVHETLHQLGIINTNELLLTEGITDAYTDLIMCYLGKESYPTEYYFEARTLAYQIIAVDKDLPHLYFETDDFSLADRISEKLCLVPQNFVKRDTLGKTLYELLSILFSNNVGVLVSENPPYVYAYDSQEIVRSYCQTFNPSEETIDYIRNHYLLEDFESLIIIQKDSGYYIQ